MEQENRRKFSRARLRLRIARLEGLDPIDQPKDLWTSNVSAGGMFFHVPLATEPAVGAALSFELSVPPGEGYSSSAGKVRGTGQIIRALPLTKTASGVAVQFTQPLALQF